MIRLTDDCKRGEKHHGEEPCKKQNSAHKSRIVLEKILIQEKRKCGCVTDE
jgi:hypothetical protein